MGLYDLTFYDVICRNAVCYRNKSAWVEAENGSEMTFSCYRGRVDRLARGLQKKGIGHHDRIGVVGKNSAEYFLLYGAAAAIGAVMLPVNWRLSVSEMLFNLNDCGPRIIFADPEFHGALNECKEKLSSAPVLCSLKEGSAGFEDINTLMNNGGDFARPDVASGDGFVIIHTAAVAGRPRGALLSHSNLLCANAQFTDCLGLTGKDVHLNLLPMFHIAGLATMASAFQAGALNVNLSRFDAAKAMALIENRGATFFFSFAPILGNLLDQQSKSGGSLRTLRAVIGLDVPQVIQKYQDISGGTFYSFYGQTETSCIATVSPYNDRPGAAGLPIVLGDVRVVDENDLPVAVGQTGEIVMRGPMVFKGYWGLEDDNKYTFRNGWHHTGDLGRFDEDGFLWFAGRKPEKELIKPGGENVYPAEVENAVLLHPAVEKCVVIGVPDPKWKEGIKAVCQLREGSSLTAAELIKFVSTRIASYKKPQYVQFVSEIPLKIDGTPDRNKTKELYGGEQKTA